MKILLPFILVLAANYLPAQKITGRITYEYKQRLQDVEIPRKATLVFTDSTSVFFHSRGSGIVSVNIDGDIGGPFMSYTSGPEHNGKSCIDFYKKDKEGNTVYTNVSDDVMKAREIIYFRSFIYEEPGVPSMDWHLIDSTKQIGGYICRAATVEFRGRTYFAWYTPEIPVPLGPWKLQGLPGLILDVRDSDRRIVFEVSTINLQLKQKALKEITPPRSAKREISFEEYKTIHWREQLRVNRVAESSSDRGSGYSNIRRHNTLEIFDQ